MSLFKCHDELRLEVTMSSDYKEAEENYSTLLLGGGERERRMQYMELHHG